jgi:branched-chain amino acid aminotransferase
MLDCIGQWFLINGEQREVAAFDESVLNSENMIYEVLRVEDGVVIFIEDYLKRLEKTIHISKMVLTIQLNEIPGLILKLIRANDCIEGPVKMMFSADTSVIYLMKPYKPEPEEYLSGIKTIKIHQERENPNAKFWNPVQRDQIAQKLKENQAFEALLINQNEELTEGSRSNVFFVKDNALYTAPEFDVLPGITRMKVLDVCRSENIRVIEEKILVNLLERFDAAFLTGTSRKVLPIRLIDFIKFNPGNQLVKKISEGFDSLTREYILMSKST